MFQPTRVFNLDTFLAALSYQFDTSPEEFHPPLPLDPWRRVPFPLAA